MKKSQVGFEFEFITSLNDYTLRKMFREIGAEFGKGRNKWHLVDDVSLTYGDGVRGRELISPPMSVTESKKYLSKVLKLFRQCDDIFTDKSTGLHVNVDIGDVTQYIDPVSTIISLDDSYMLKIWEREDNQYCLPFRKQIKTLINRYRKLKNKNITAREYVNKYFDPEPYAAYRNRDCYKYSINFEKLECKHPYVELRYMGGENYEYHQELIVDCIKNSIDSLKSSVYGTQSKYVESKLRRI